jgi:hypothetical protein
MVTKWSSLHLDHRSAWQTTAMAAPPDIAFDQGSFQPAYDLVPEPEFPGSGAWPFPVFCFDQSGELSTEPMTRWGAPLVVEIHPFDSPSWVATFAAGGLGGVTGLYACPASSDLVALVDGAGYLVDVAAPDAGAEVAHHQVSQVVGVAGDLLLLVRFIDIVAIGTNGIAWRSERLAVDDLQVEHATAERIVSSGDLLDTELTPIVLDPRTGSQIEGLRLDSFWPKNAM